MEREDQSNDHSPAEKCCICCVLADQVTAASSSDIRNTFVSEYFLFYGGPEGSNGEKGCKSKQMMNISQIHK